MFNVRIRQVRRSISVEVGSTILQAALDNGIDYPHGCQSGNCGACKSVLHHGDVELSPYSEYALSQEEVDDDLILACRAVPWSDCEVSWRELDASSAHPVRVFESRVENIESLTHDVVSVAVGMPRDGAFVFSPGQFAILAFEGFPEREYSIASRLQDRFLEFYVRRIDGGAVSPFMVDNMRAGEPVTVTGPFGNMHYRREHEGPIIALAGGSGLSAVQPIVMESLDLDPQRSVRLYHGVRRESDIFRADVFERPSQENTNFQYSAVLSEPRTESRHRGGLLAEIIDADIESIECCKAYLAGPPPMVASCADVLKRKGMTAEDIHADPFYTEADRA